MKILSVFISVVACILLTVGIVYGNATDTEKSTRNYLYLADTIFVPLQA